MKTKQFVDRQRILNILGLEGESYRLAKEAMIMGRNFVKVTSAMKEDKND